MIERKANLIFINGSVYTVDKNRTWAQTAVIDLGGKMVLPGFVDAHAHPSHAMDFVGNISLYLLDSLGEYEKAIA